MKAAANARSPPRSLLQISLALVAITVVGALWLWPTRVPEEPGALTAEPTPSTGSPAPSRTESLALTTAEPRAPAAEVRGPAAPEPDIDGDWIAELQRAGQRPYQVRLTLARAGSPGHATIGMNRTPT